MKIISVIVSLTKDGLVTKELEYDAIECKEIFKLSRIDFDGEKIKRNLKKCDINRINDTKFQVSTTNITYQMYTTPDLVEEKKQIVKKQVCDMCNTLKTNIDKLSKHICSEI